MAALFGDIKPVLNCDRILERLADFAVVRPRQSVVPAQHWDSGANELCLAKRTWCQSRRPGIFRDLAAIPVAAVSQQVA
jgi:hypothetical protein